jgi:TatD DNase family protein
MRYFDAHCHPQFSEYDADRDAVLAAMEQEGVGGLVVGTDAATSRAACELVQGRENLFAAVGLHPNHAVGERFDEHEFRNLLMYPNTVAIGECGIDYFRMEDATDEPKKAQKELFERHVRLAGQTKRPLVIHARPTKGTMDAYQDALAILADAKRDYGDALTGDFHFFAGDIDIAREVLKLDFTLSFTAVITFARNYDEVIRSTPLDRILAETDSPYVAPASRRGKRNDPLAVIEVVRALAEVRGEPEEVVRETTLANAQRLFTL